MACASNNTPRITNINDQQSGIAYRPGSKLNISGCGFGTGGQTFLIGGGVTLPLVVDTRPAGNINSGHIARFAGANSLTLTSPGSWNLLAGDLIVQDEHCLKMPPACYTDKSPVSLRHFSVYQLKVVVTGPVGVTPPRCG